jgi:hypothetical protein
MTDALAGVPGRTVRQILSDCDGERFLRRRAPTFADQVLDAAYLLERLDAQDLRRLARYLWPGVATREVGLASRVLLALINCRLNTLEATVA